jgi:hypothetical protein
MKYYSYNEITKEYNGTINANINPLETQKQGHTVYLQPALTTDIKPSDTKENEVAVFENENWVIKEDHRGKEIYNTGTAEQETINEIGQIPVDFTELPPPNAHPLWNETDREWGIDLTKQQEENDKKIIEEKIQAKIRELAIENLKISGDLPIDYKE